MGYFDGSVVTPCGIGDRGVTSLARALGDRGRRCPTVEEVGRVATECFGEVFGVDLIRGEKMIR
jgi:lipoate-protein ligase B